MTDLSLPPFGRLAWVDVVLLVWFALTLVSVVYVAYDAFTRNPEMKVMRWGWVLVTLYLGPIGSVVYVLSCQNLCQGCTRSSFGRSGSRGWDR